MRTKKITLFYKLSDSEIFAPDGQALRRKDEWIKEVQRSIATAGELRTVRVVYELFNPEVLQQLKFFNGPIVEYFAIQNSDILTGRVPTIIKEKYRETILSEALGYNVELIGGTERRRKSTAEFVSTQQWHDFFELLKETIFEPHGYEMPDSEEFWELSEKNGYDQARKIAIEKLQKRLKAKMEDKS